MNVKAFIAEEKKYILLMLLTILVYSIYFGVPFTSSMSGVGEPEVAAVSSVDTAEDRIAARMQDETYWSTVFEEKPVMGFMLFSGVILVLAGMGYGLVMDVLWLTKRLRGHNVIRRVDRLPEGASGRPRDLLKVPILFMSISVASAIIIQMLRLFVDGVSEFKFLILLHTALTDLAVIFCIVWFLKNTYERGIDSLGLRFSTWVRDTLLGVTAYAGTLPFFLLLLFVLITVSSWLGYEPPPHPLVEALVEEGGSAPVTVVLSVVLACVLGPIVEELFFRGFCYPILRKKWGVWPSILVTSAAFAGVHHSEFAFLPVFMLGVVLALLYERRGTLMPSIVLHMAHNTLFLSYFFVLKALFLGD